MNKQRITFIEKDVYEAARKHFIRACGIKLGDENNNPMYKEGLKIHHLIAEGIHIDAMISKFSPDVFKGNEIHIEGNKISCESFSQIPEDNVISIYMYMITWGECCFNNEDSLMRQFLSDVWMTSYLDAGRDMLEETIRKDGEQTFVPWKSVESSHLSPCYAPGFFGMEIKENKKIAEILGSEMIGIRVNDSGVMLPIKSCSGIYLAVKDPKGLPLNACQDCCGNNNGCRQCKIMHLEMQ